MTTDHVSTFNPTVGLLVIAEVPGIGVEEDDAMAAALGFDDGIPGCSFRLTGPMDGGRRVVTYWETAEQYEAWRDGRLAEVLKATGNPVPRMTSWEMDPAGAGVFRPAQ